MMESLFQYYENCKGIMIYLRSLILSFFASDLQSCLRHLTHCRVLCFNIAFMQINRQDFLAWTLQFDEFFEKTEVFVE